MAEIQNLQDALEYFDRILMQAEVPDKEQAKLACETIVQHRLELDNCVIIRMPEDFSSDPAWRIVMEGSEAHPIEGNCRIVHCH